MGKDNNDDGGDHCGYLPVAMAPLSLRLAVANDLKHKRPTPRCGDGVCELARRHPSRQLAAVCRRGLLTIAPTAPTPAPLRVFFFF